MLVLLLTAGPCVSEPWLDTRDAGLRADIERLSAAGAVTVPINTWPLMWSGILNDLHAFDVQQYPDLQASYGRVMVEANKASGLQHIVPQQNCPLPVNQSSCVILAVIAETRAH